MQFNKINLTNAIAAILVFSALLTTILFVKRELTRSATPTATNQDWSAIYADGWQEALSIGIRVGNANAPVQIVIFEDFQCPHCARFDSIVKIIRDKYPDEVAFTFAPYPLPYHDFAESAQHVAECAHAQGRFEVMRSLLFEKQADFGSIAWTSFAGQAKIEDISRFDSCVNAPDSLGQIEQSKIIADRFGVRGTPTIFVNGWKLPVTPSSEAFDKMVTNVVEGRPPPEDIDFLASVARY